MQPEFVTVPSSIDVFAGIAGLLAVVTILYYGFSRSQKYEYSLKNRVKKNEQP